MIPKLFSSHPQLRMLQCTSGNRAGAALLLSQVPKNLEVFKQNDMAGWKVHTVEEEHHLKSSEYDLWPKDLPKKGGDIFTILDDEVLPS